MTESVEQLVIEILSDYTNVAVTKDSHIENDLGMDSLDGIMAVMEVEERLDICIPNELVENIKTVGELIRLAEFTVGGKNVT